VAEKSDEKKQSTEPCPSLEEGTKESSIIQPTPSAPTVNEFEYLPPLPQYDFAPAYDNSSRPPSYSLPPIPNAYIPVNQPYPTPYNTVPYNAVPYNPSPPSMQQYSYYPNNQFN
jgi:hypothetical protein